MGRCPTYLNVDNFDDLAHSLALSLTDEGVSALGEIVELLSIQILEAVDSDSKSIPIDFAAIIAAARSLEISLDLDPTVKTVRGARISTVPTLMSRGRHA